jgi:hypothetical protein
MELRINEHPAALRSSPIELPAAERCIGAKRRQLRFIWNFAS